MDARHGTTSLQAGHRGTRHHSPQVDLPLQHSGMGHPAGVPLQQPIGRACPAATRGRRTRSTNTSHVDHPRMAPSASQLRKAELPAATAREAMHAHTRVINCFKLTSCLALFTCLTAYRRMLNSNTLRTREALHGQISSRHGHPTMQWEWGAHSAGAKNPSL